VPLATKEVDQPRQVAHHRSSVQAQGVACCLEFRVTCSGTNPEASRVARREIDQEERDRHHRDD